MRKKLNLNKKVYICDIQNNDDLLIKLLDNNSKLEEKVYEYYYEDTMFQQEEFGTCCLGEKHYNWIDFHDNYNSFYLRLKNWDKFIMNIDSDYLDTKELELYNYIMQKRDVLYNMCQYSDNYDRLEEHLENKCDELLELIENDLHDYENYNFEDIKDYFIDTCMINGWFNDLYFYKNRYDYTLYEDISYSKSYC